MSRRPPYGAQLGVSESRLMTALAGKGYQGTAAELASLCGLTVNRTWHAIGALYDVGFVLVAKTGEQVNIDLTVPGFRAWASRLPRRA